MNKYLRDLQILAGLAAMVLAVPAVLGLLRSLNGDFDPLSAILAGFLATLVALATWFAVRAQVPAARANLRAAWRGGLVLGGIAFAVGYVGPLLLYPDSNQGPLFGIFVTGPLGFVAGVAVGLGWRLSAHARATRRLAAERQGR
jgi:hypothetical protein